MSKKNDGGPAFPEPVMDFAQYRGMTLRDYFAARAMQAFITGAMSDGTAFNPKSGDHDAAAEVAYLIADAMLRAREES